MLFDCDEGTLQQLNRKFGYEKTLEILKNLKAIYISHLHADHQMGFIGIVQQREAGLLTDDFNQIWSLTQLYFVALFVFSTDGPKQNATSLLTPVSNIVF